MFHVASVAMVIVPQKGLVTHNQGQIVKDKIVVQTEEFLSPVGMFVAAVRSESRPVALHFAVVFLDRPVAG